MDVDPAHAMIRFGLGRRGSEPLPRDPLAWLSGQLDGPDQALAAPTHSTSEVLIVRREDTKLLAAANPPHRSRQIWLDDAATAIGLQIDAEAPFRERLVWFWANHFTVSVRRGEVHALAVPYVQEAIRPHVTGRFSDMLLAVMRHPAMLSYLDNADSFGPDSPAGQRLHRGLNENLARECLELHTVTPSAGYTQQDVTAFARILTGWGYDLASAAPGYLFYPLRHQPGFKTMMGQTYPEGEGGGSAALAWLANHPATFRNIATHLLRHFVADYPAPADIARVETVLRRTGGDLKAGTLEMLRLPAAWQPLTKVRAPADYAVAVLRALDLPAPARPDMLGVVGALGQPFMAAPLPNGWPDSASVWAEGELLLRRADWAVAVAGRAPALDPVGVAHASLGDLLSRETLRAVQRAPSRQEGLALLLASPEFQRR